jgi:hypothetical protein
MSSDVEFLCFITLSTSFSCFTSGHPCHRPPSDQVIISLGHLLSSMPSVRTISTCCFPVSPKLFMLPIFFLWWVHFICLSIEKKNLTKSQGILCTVFAGSMHWYFILEYFLHCKTSLIQYEEITKVENNFFLVKFYIDIVEVQYLLWKGMITCCCNPHTISLHCDIKQLVPCFGHHIQCVELTLLDKCK